MAAFSSQPLAINPSSPSKQAEASDDQPEMLPKKTIASVLQSKVDSVQQKKNAASLLEKSTYQYETQRPLVCLAFILPLILVYELGTLMLGSSAFRSGVDQWLHQMLNSIGFGQLVLLPVVTIGILLAWHHKIDDHWRIRLPVLSTMAFEAIGLGLMLFWAANIVHLFSHTDLSSTEVASVAPDRWLARLMSTTGSGIYEELFFRLLFLLPAIHYIGKVFDKKTGTVLGIVFVSLVFSALHYNVINPAGIEFEVSSFFFRFVASIVFCVLFLFRGFGVAVGTHVAFDVLTQA